ncbi:hypothetical protein PUN28_013781 [Cardiocondyla obscurior]|uniref:Connector enhancer of kinase suppressor of ras 2 n=1 Tax=Cardiocondyla obscurior TaxID=286306 RepID=A0AAW2F770_9HYME
MLTVGLDSTVRPYIHSFLNHSINGHQLLNLQPQDLEDLGVVKLGHQEIILEAVEYLRRFHYELDKENLQLLALRLSSQAYSLHKELCRQYDSEPLTTQTLSDVASIMMVVKPLVRWMDYPPFSGHIEYHSKKVELMKISIEMATCAQRDRFAEKPVREIRKICSKLTRLAEYIIQDITDPIILQPASLDLATLKKKSSDDLGFYILPSFHGVHQITEIKLGSAAHQSGKMQEGDEIVQVNYQTVVGWERKNLLELFRESPAEILLTMKRRPKHTKTYGPIYIKPYKLPSNKNTSYTAQGRSLPSPRPELLTIPDFAMPSRHMPKKTSPESASILDAVNMLDTMTTDSSDSDSETESQLYPKPRNLVQRRATITGASPTTKHGINIEQFWKELKREHNATVQLRDKAASCAHGLDNVPMVNIRPQTCLGLESAKKKKTNEQTNKKVQFEEKLTDAKNSRRDDAKEKVTLTQNCNDDGANIVNRDIYIEHLQPSTDNVNTSNNFNDATVPLDESNSSIISSDTCSINENVPHNKEIGMQYAEKRGKLDKNYSTSAYDLLDTEKLDLPDHYLLKPNNNLTKIDVRKIIENINDHKKVKGASSEHKEASIKKCDGNVAKKISNIEKQIAHENAEEQTCAFGVPKRINPQKNNIYITINDVNLESSTEKKNQNNFEDDISDINNKKCPVKRLSIECKNNEYSKSIDLKNSACEYFEDAGCGTSEISNECSNNYHSSNNNANSINSNRSSSNSNNSSSSDGGVDDDGGGGGDSSNNSNNFNCSYSSSSSSGSSSSSNHSNSIKKNKTLVKFDKVLQTVNCISTQHAELLEKKKLSSVSKENSTEIKMSPNNNTKFIGDDISNITQNILKMQMDVKQQTKEIKSADSSSATIQSCRYIELPKVESVRKLETKSHATPPEPPPRKYYTNQAITDLKLNNVSQNLEDSQISQIPEKLGIKKDLKKVDLSSCVNYVKANSDCQDKKDSSDVRMLHYTENSMDLIAESRNISLNDQKFDRLNLSDASLYNESNDKQSREDKSSFEKYETFVEKFVCSDQSITNCYRFDHSPCNVDCPDGITHSKHTVPSDLKSRLTEKDKSIEKSVVNRAMMVAKSIGLHSSLNKYNSSPRSNRKRNMLLAKGRNVSVRDVGPGDLEGWLTYRCKGAGGAWAKAWFVLKCSSLYRFKTQDSTKADCLIVLTGFTVSPASEVKSRKYSFKVYHTGTVFYFAADSEDSLILWLDAVSKGTLGADTQSQSGGLYSETDESDNENYKNKSKCTSESKLNPEKPFGSLKKSVRRDAGLFKDHELVGASLDRKYLKFLSARNQNMPVPTAQFRSYRRVLPTSTPKKEACNSNSPDLQMTIAGSTFYGSTTSQSELNSPNMSDYRHASDRSGNKRSDSLQGSITQEEFAMSQQDEEQQSTISESISPRATPLFSDHVHVQHKNLNDNATYAEQIRQLSDASSSDLSIYGKINDDIPNNNIKCASLTNTNVHTPRQFIEDNFIARPESEANCVSDKPCSKCMAIAQKKMRDSTSYAQKRRAQELVNSQKTKHDESFYRRNVISPNRQNSSNQNIEYDKRIHSPNHENYKMHDYLSPRNIGYSKSNSDFSNYTSSEAQQCVKKDVTVSRKGSFNLPNRQDHNSSDKHWLDSLRRSDKKGSSDKIHLKNVAQYQPPPIPTSPFEQEGMRAAFEMHLDKNDHVQKASRLKVLFGAKQQKSCTLDLPKNTPKTVLEAGSPRLHRAVQRSSSNHKVIFPNSTSISPRNIAPPVLPYIPPPTSPPPDYPGLEYPSIFEPETYSLSDASLLRNCNNSSQNISQ